MPPPNPPPEQSTPNNAARRASASKPSTPANNRKASANAGATPKSAPAGAAPGAGPAKKKPAEPPSLLTDFLLGRPSPQRVRASQSQPRRKSVALDAAGVREELRQEMRAAAVRKLQQPGGVRDRVKNWQKANATAMKTGVAMKPEVVEDVASEPTEILVQVDAESVTEEDRVRIKMRQKPRRRSKTPAGTGEGGKEGDRGDAGEPVKAVKREKAGVEIHQDPPSASKPRPLPKKRIVSDEHWMKQRQGRRSPPRKSSPKAKVEGSPAPLPKDFLARTAQNPSIHDKIKDWTQRVEIPDAPLPPKVRKYRTKGGESITIEEEGSVGSGSTSRPSRTSQPADDGIRVTPGEPKNQKGAIDDGIRIKPIRVKEVKEPPDDGIRVKPTTKSLPDDGIRIRPGPEVEADEVTVRSTSSRHRPQERSSKVPSRRRGGSPDGTIEATEEPEPDTPTRRRGTARRRPRRSISPTTVTQTQTDQSTEITSRVSNSDDESEIEPSQVLSDLPSIAPGSKSLADIPVGYSAFSELDLPLGADARNSIRRPKTQRNSSLKAVPKVLKSLVSEGKKIISHEKVIEPPPRTGFNKPPSIENWLSTTVDPFVDADQPKKSSVEKEWVKDTRRRSSSEASAAPANRSRSTERREDQENADPAKAADDDTTPKKAKTPSGSGLKRKGATRSTSSPLKPGQRKPFKEQLKDAFRGESGGHKFIPPVYPSYEARPEPVEDTEYSDSERYEQRRNSSGSTGRSRSPDPASTVGSSSSIGPLPNDSGFPRRKPPTNGFHELSTIVSEASHRTYESDTVSTVSQSTITQSTALTKSTDISRGASQKSQSGLKRRLTKHSDLVSVLSLPDNGHLQAPVRTRSIRSGGRLLRKTSKILDNTPIEDLLQEFVDDEHYYQRELKTLVDGVVPVLLKQVVNGDGHSKDLFGSPSPLAERVMSKAVVEMGISLEKLKNFHRRVPLSDVQLLLAWLESVHPIYDRYLDVWRLGFQDLIINLAPAAGKSAEEDSLVNALPRNEDGDALDENGEPVDVAHLLKRPLVRIKWMVKLIRGAHKIQPTVQLEELLSKFEKLQDKARRRHREETARKTDEDANNTDVTRTRDLRSLSAIDAVVIDQSRQVNAKDAFSLDLKHSNGQRLECRVEVIFRDNVSNPADKGDILVRETGTGGRSWLLFPPIPKDKISARKGDSDRELTVMIRGYHNYRDWFELLTLSCDDEDQIADWLDILGSDPLPPTLKAHLDSRARLALAASPKAAEVDIPVGERKLRKQPPGSPTAKPETPTRYHKRSPSVPTTPTTPTETEYATPSPNKTPTQTSFSTNPRDDRLTLPSAERGTPIREGTRPDPAKLTKTPPSPTSYREDGAPPPPAHRTLKKSPPVLLPPVDIGSSRVKRRGSSPLKHEYHPSDISSESSVTNSDESDLSDTDSSSDELDESDVPDILPAISIKEKITTPADSVISDSSLTPSASASQAGVLGGEKSPTEWCVKAIASISYWSNKRGIWKDVDPEACSIVITPGLIEAFPLSHADLPKLSHGLSDAALGDRDGGAPRPLIALDLTPLVMIRMSNTIDLEIRSPVRPYSILNKIEGAFFRFRSPSAREGALLYDAVHVSRMNNAKFKALEEEARFRSFGQQQNSLTPEHSGDVSTSSKRRSWFGRKNSYRASARAPSESQGSSSGVSASSFLKRLTGGGNTSFNIDKSTVDKQSRPPSTAGGATTITGSGSGSGPGSLYTSSASSSGGGTLFRAPSLSIADSGKGLTPGDRMPIRLYNAVPNKKWEDYGNCILQILRPPPGMHQELRVYHGMEKRIKITSPAKKEGEEDLIVLDVVLGSGCFNRLGTKGVVVKVWEDIRDTEGNVGFAPATGGLSGKMKTWCLQTKTNAEAAWVVSLLTQEVDLG